VGIIPSVVHLRGPPRRFGASDVGMLGSPQVSSPLVLARFQQVAFRHQLIPFFLASWLAADLVKFEKSEMGAAVILRPEY
jgi:hypothetical protein